MMKGARGMTICEGYTGRRIWAEVTHIQRGYGLPDDVVVMSIRVVAQRGTSLADARGFVAAPEDHELKTDPAPFAAVWAGLKACEIRRDDRGFKVGDCLLLREHNRAGKESAR